MIKLGPHIIGATDDAFTWGQVAPIVKQVDGTDVLAVSPPGAITIYRHVWAEQDLRRNGGDVARELLGLLQGFRPTYVELLNEWGFFLGQGEQGLERHVEFTREASEVIHQAGLKVCGFNFPVTHPTEQAWRYIQDHGFGGCDALGVHEYWNSEGFVLEWALRHRLVHQWLGSNHPPFLITECGRDVIRPSDGVGWKNQNVCPADYVQELFTYDLLLAQDSYVLGGTPFTVGPSRNFLPFELDILVPALLGYGDAPPCVPPGGGGSWLVAGAILVVLGGILMVRVISRPEEVVEVAQAVEIEAGEPVPPGWRVVG